MDEFQKFRNFIYDRTLDVSYFHTSIYKRTVHALLNQHTLGKLDLASLIRNILRYESEKQGGKAVLLKVPKGSGWPKRHEWHNFGIEIIDEQEDSLLIEGTQWFPKWLEQSNNHSIDQPLFAHESRKQLKKVEGDPFLSVLNKEFYRSKSQKDAIRSILTAPAGATLVVNLPTGTGKSLCAQLPAVLHGKNYGLTVVVVPTIALAIDQERAMSPYVSHATAYYGGDENQEINEEIRKRIMDGTQKIVFASPESLLNSLQFPLQIATERGFLKMFIIDEAHMIGLWGDEFRPAFQELSGFRENLLSLSIKPFTTLLLSATYNEVCLDTIETLFSKPGPFNIFSSVQLRPEPAYWVKKCESEELKREYLFDSIAHLPKPLIIYTTKVVDANQLGRELRNKGYNRSAIFTGDTSFNERNIIIQKWQDRELDIIVATSAFGLGIDQSDVRGVIHACLPENIDRFYQEVGRGGRDGCASLSLLLYTDEDIKLAEKMSHNILIGVERGEQRWRQMFLQKRNFSKDSEFFYVPINVSPSYGEADIDMSSKQNQAWNIRTLNLMNRAGLIKLLWEERRDGKEYFGKEYRLVKIVDPFHLNHTRWEEIVQPLRQKTRESQTLSLNLMKQYLNVKKCVSEIFSKVYEVPAKIEPPRKSINVSLACGGCPFCRKVNKSPFIRPLLSKPVEWPRRNLGKVDQSFLLRYLGKEDKKLVLFYPDNKKDFNSLSKREKHSWRMVIRWFLDQDVQHIIGNKIFLEMLKQDLTLFDGRIVFLTDIEQIPKRLDWPHVDTLIIHPEAEQILRPIHNRMIIKNSLAQIFIMPEGIEDPTNSKRRLRDVVTLRNYKMEEFKIEVGIN